MDETELSANKYGTSCEVPFVIKDIPSSPYKRHPIQHRDRTIKMCFILWTFIFGFSYHVILDLKVWLDKACCSIRAKSFPFSTIKRTFLSKYSPSLCVNSTDSAAPPAVSCDYQGYFSLVDSDLAGIQGSSAFAGRWLCRVWQVKWVIDKPTEICTRSSPIGDFRSSFTLALSWPDLIRNV